jgi:hypothetical protein
VTKRQKFALLLLPFPVGLFLLSFTGWAANDYVFYGALALIFVVQIAMLVIRIRYDRHER